MKEKRLNSLRDLPNQFREMNKPICITVTPDILPEGIFNNIKQDPTEILKYIKVDGSCYRVTPEPVSPNLSDYRSRVRKIRVLDKSTEILFERRGETEQLSERKLLGKIEVWVDQ